MVVNIQMDMGLPQSGTKQAQDIEELKEYNGMDGIIEL